MSKAGRKFNPVTNESNLKSIREELSYSQILETHSHRRYNRMATVKEDDESDKGTQDWEGGNPVDDAYRFVQPRRLSSWVQDDAVSACFKCHAPFTILFRKHHCRACGRIFCNTCSSQRLVIPVDYEATPLITVEQPYYASLGVSAGNLLGGIEWLLGSSMNEINNKTIPNTIGPSSASSLGSSTFHISGSSSTSQRFSLHERSRLNEEMKRLQREYPDLCKGFKLGTSFTSSDSGKSLLQKSLNSSSDMDRSNSGVHPISQSDFIPAGSTSQRVCDDCASALQQRRQHQDTVQVFELCGFDLQELRLLGFVCRKWHRASMMCISTFRQIQYYLPTHELAPREKRLLYINRHFLSGHSKWMLQLIKAMDWNNVEEIDEIISLFSQPRKYGCMMTMCSRLCRDSFGVVDALEILKHGIYHPTFRKISVSALQTATKHDWRCFLPVLLHSLLEEPYSDISRSCLGEALISHALHDITFRFELFWSLVVYGEDDTIRRKIEVYKQSLLVTLLKTEGEEAVTDLMRGLELIDVFAHLPVRCTTERTQQALRRELKASRLFESIDRKLALPLDPKVKIAGLNWETLVVKGSAESPIIVSCLGVESTNGSTGVNPNILQPLYLEKKSFSSPKSLDKRDFPRKTNYPNMPDVLDNEITLSSYKLMYKRDDLRKDAMVQKIISVMYNILKEEAEIDVPLVTYQVVPTSSKDGLIEIVQNAETLYSIIRDHGNILNFLRHYNGHRTFNDIASSFQESLAAYTVITFLLGVGDRHPDNIMLTHDGTLFHIDYGFILGKDPKPSQPPMRLDSYMIEALGGYDTPQYKAFQALCVRAFNCLRRHVSLFMLMISLVVKILDEPNFNTLNINSVVDNNDNLEDLASSLNETCNSNVPKSTDSMNHRLYRQNDNESWIQELEAFVVQRFLPGQTDEEAAIALTLRMEGKLNERIGLTLSDFVHAHASEKTVSRSMDSVGSSVRVGVETVGSTVQSVASSLSSGASSLYEYVWGRS